MRKILIIIIAGLLATISAGAQRKAHERVLLSTDRVSYVAGEQIWCSAFCLDAAEGSATISDISSIAYVELISTDGPCACSKIALVSGRGCASVTVPVEAPTGNYLLIAYTALQKEEGVENILKLGKPITIYNTLTNQRLSGGYEISKSKLAKSPRQELSADKGLTISCPEISHKNEAVPVTISYSGSTRANVSISICHIDSLEQFQHKNLQDIINSDSFLSYNPKEHFTPEYDGEIIHAYIKGEIPSSMIGSPAFISSTGHDSNIYSSSVDEKGEVTFYTGNIFGEDDLVFQIVQWDPDEDYAVEIQSPFLQPTVPEGMLDKLIIDEDLSEQLRLRSLSMQIGTRFHCDTLFARLPSRTNLLYSRDKFERYNLDDFVRYPTMSELVVEILKEVKMSKEDGVETLSIRLKDDISYNHDKIVFSAGSLIMLDGVPVLDHKKFLEYDPLLLEAVEIYPYSIVTGERIFGGSANFITKKGNLSGADFDKRTKVMSFKGVEFPMRFTPESIGDNIPDYRQTLYWNPIVNCSSEDSLKIICPAPSYPGTFRIRVEGFDKDGKYICQEKDFKVR